LMCTLLENLVMAAIEATEVPLAWLTLVVVEDMLLREIAIRELGVGQRWMLWLQ